MRYAVSVAALVGCTLIVRAADSAGDAELQYQLGNLLSDETDARRLLSGVQRLQMLLEHPAMQALGTPDLPRTDLAGVRANLGDYVHASGTCAIGRVLDPLCRLIGYEGVRVCDASVMPDLPRANTHLTTVAVAERLASVL